MDFHFMIDSLPKLISVIPMTIYISVVSVIVGFALAAIIAIIREKKLKFFLKSLQCWYHLSVARQS